MDLFIRMSYTLEILLGALMFCRRCPAGNTLHGG